MKNISSIPKILKINKITGYKVSFLFNNGISKTIDFEAFFTDLKSYSQKHPAYKLMQDKKAFDQIEIIGNTIGWKNTGIYSTDVTGKKVFYHYDLDPIVLFESSKIDAGRSILIGTLIKQARKEAGLTQEELAKKSGISKYYLSRLENNKSDIELGTLKKIVEAGLGKKLNIEIN